MKWVERMKRLKGWEIEKIGRDLEDGEIERFMGLPGIGGFRFRLIWVCDWVLGLRRVY